jgi:FG-GAP-like repeat
VNTPRPPHRLLAALLIGALLAAPLIARQRAEPRAFDRMLLLEDSSTTSASVSLGDLDRDGDLDIVLAKGRHWPVQNRVLRNNGRGQFTATALSDTADRTYSAALADLNGDGILDLVVSNDRPDLKRIYVGEATGTFRAVGTFGEALWSTRYITLADVNGDARPDIIVANRGGNPARPQQSLVCLNDGRAAFPVCTPLATTSATIIVAADLDADGHVDLFVPHRDGGQSRIFWNDGSGRFAAPSQPIGPTAVEVRAAAAGDIDGDGRIDLIIGDLRTNQLLLFRSTGARQFGDSAHIGSNAIAAGAIALADLNKDGTLDLVVGAAEGRGTIHFNHSRGSQRRFESIPWNDGAGTVYGIAIGDLDGDSWPDIAVARSDAPNAVWFSTAAKRSR